MNGLPGRLTVAHIEGAKARGDNYIYYKDRNYSIEELESLVRKPDRSKSASSKPHEDDDKVVTGHNDRPGNVGKRGSNRDEKGSPVRPEPVEGNSKGTS